MEEFKQFLMQLVETIDWQDTESCKAAAREIMDHYSEKVGNRARDIINGIYGGLYAGFDAVSDFLREKGLNGIQLWTALHLDATERYADKPLAKLLAVLSIIAQEVRSYNDVAYHQYKATRQVGDVSLLRAVERLEKMRPVALKLPENLLATDVDVNVFSQKMAAVMFANSFRQLDLEMYNKDKFHDIFVGFFNDFAQSKTIIEGFGDDLIGCAQQLSKPLPADSKYRKLYSDACVKLRR